MLCGRSVQDVGQRIHVACNGAVTRFPMRRNRCVCVSREECSVEMNAREVNVQCVNVSRQHVTNAARRCSDLLRVSRAHPLDATQEVQERENTEEGVTRSHTRARTQVKRWMWTGGGRGGRMKRTATTPTGAERQENRGKEKEGECASHAVRASSFSQALVQSRSGRSPERSCFYLPPCIELVSKLQNGSNCDVLVVARLRDGHSAPAVARSSRFDFALPARSFDGPAKELRKHQLVRVGPVRQFIVRKQRK